MNTFSEILEGICTRKFFISRYINVKMNNFIGSIYRQVQELGTNSYEGNEAASLKTKNC